ncbi:MAG TPA: PspC domain-containing protein [Cyclobacteriaceae bacterium]|jgi:phage shock protein PspC (stress-responsive transcriptional regulator)|nr:PspC domain-containing protein [Cytophagales bacterium]HNT50127.1 PspC domain-containing protein [Cyclobacteriaceae bacterium]
MKKNISINISGIIFHIEEDGYETLRKYLDSIKRYFATFEDSSEILSDIESRIAEIFLAKLNEGKQVITAEDVSSLMTTMGSVSDFKAAEEQEFAGEYTTPPDTTSSTGTKTTARKLLRDQKRKILGGVCAGLAHYFNIDPVWPRLLFALTLVLSYGGLFLIYIILWILLPGSDELEDEPSVKKMFRDPERKVIGGVAGGIAAFFGADLAIIRLVFVIFAIFGVGFLTYIILWIVLPEAKTITEKMQMQGEPVTLSNIESTVKKGLNEKEHGEESTLAKIVLFPFRLIAMVIDGLAKVLGPLMRVIVDVLRVAIGIAISLTGLFIMLSLLFTVGVIFGVFHLTDWAWWNVNIGDIGLPLEAMRNTFPSWTVVFAFLVAFIPALFINLIGNSIIAKRITFNPLVGWSLFVLFFISIAAVGISVPQIVYAFKEEGEYKTEKTFLVQGKVAVLRMREMGLDDYDMTSLVVKGYEGTDIKLIQRFEAQGNTRKVAAENAQMVNYNVEQQDSVLVFDSNMTFKPEAKFRAQRLNMELYIPYNILFVVEEDMWHIIDNNYRDYDGYTDSFLNKTWRMTPNGFECTNCEHPSEEQRIRLSDQYGIRDFARVDLTGIFDVEIRQGDVFAVQLDGPEEEKSRYTVSREGETLTIDYRTNRKMFWDRNILDDEKVKIKIIMPSLKELKAKGAGKINFNGFFEEDVEIELTGAMVAEGELEARNLTIELTGATVLELRGQGDFMEANATGASSLKAFNYEVDEAVIAARGVSSSKVNVSRKLQTTKDITSSISNRGDAEVIDK